MTRTLHQFHGGLILDAHMGKESKQPIAEPIIAPVFVLPLKQHMGSYGDVLVSEGDKVLKGQALTNSDKPYFVPIHAPTSGTICGIEANAVAHPSGLSETCILLKADFEDRWAEKQPLINYQKESKETVLTHIHKAGIAGLGGAGFPAHIKLNAEKQSQPINTLIINGAECEPYISADDALMRERADGILEGVKILAWLLQPKEILFAIEDNKPEALRAVREAAEKFEQAIEIIPVPTIYPTGGEKQLIEVLTGKEVPSKGIPQDIGIVCHNTGTAYAIHRSIEYGEPLISRIVTLAGQALSKPGNFEVYLGTPFRELLAYAGQDIDETFRLIMGGPLMGIEILNLNVPVIKTTNCIIAATESEMPSTPPEQPCIRCGACEEVCPASLLPQQLYWYIDTKNFKTAKDYQLFDCIECGACAYVCPSHIPLVQYYRFGMASIRSEEKDKDKSEQARDRFESRKKRLEREQLERDEKRKQAKALREKHAKLTGVDAKKNEIAEAIARAKAKKEDKNS